MHAKPRLRGSYKKSETSRRQVLEAAVQALAKRGYAKTSVSDIALAAGMSKGAVHYHFESKDDLIAKVLEHCATVAGERVREAWDRPGEPTERIRRAIHEMRSMRKEGVPELRVLADLTAQGLHDARLRTALGKVFETNRKQFVDHLTKSLDAMGLKSKIPVHIVPRLMLGALDGLAIHDYFDPPGVGDDELVELALDGIGLSLFEM
ncbi:MAG TPA: TetR/AcrR family transcriptional regulator [Polyangiaceae bacterium]|nr:TetR/AcrR family transcriptional regulator [Polyangiaceae bacterium]